MRVRNFLALLLSLFIMDYNGFTDAVLSQTVASDGLHWNTMGTYIRVNGNVHHLEEDVSKPGNILFSSDYSLMTTDGMTTHLVVGSGTFGYAEGVSAQAMFSHITGFLQTSSSMVLLVDHSNDCLRYVNRTTNQTSTFVGNCTSTGLSDGLYRNARFFYPSSVIRNLVNPQTAIVTDRFNLAIRSIDLTKGDVKTLIKDLPGQPYGAAFDSDQENIFITFYKFLGKLNLKTLVFTQLTPANTGGLDGEFSKAYFGNPRGILCIDKVCLVADYGTNKLRVADVAKQTIYSICTGTDSSVDGTTTNCSLRGPHSLLLTSDTLYIGESQAIRKIPVRRVFPCEDISLKLAAGEQWRCLEIMPGHTICFSPGISMYSILEKNCTIKINITKDLSVCQNNPCLNSGTRTAGENNSYMGDCKDGWTGSRCQTELDVCQNNPCLNSGICTAQGNKTYSCACSEGWTGRNCQTEINACMFNPCKNSGRCLPTNDTFTCSCNAGWTGSLCDTEDKRDKCPDEIFGTGDPKTKAAEIRLPDGDLITLPIGRYTYRKFLPDNTICEILVHVSDPRLLIRLDFAANYKLPCSALNGFKQLILSLARMRYSQIGHLSSGICNKSTDVDVLISCAADVLQVIWPTDCLFNSSSIKEKQRIHAMVHGYLDKHKVFVLDLFLPNHQPPIIQPSLNKDERPASVIWTPVCSAGLKYMNNTETCQ